MASVAAMGSQPCIVADCIPEYELNTGDILKRVKVMARHQTIAPSRYRSESPGNVKEKNNPRDTVAAAATHTENKMPAAIWVSFVISVVATP